MSNEEKDHQNSLPEQIEYLQEKVERQNQAIELLQEIVGITLPKYKDDIEFLIKLQQYKDQYWEDPSTQGE